MRICGNGRGRQAVLSALATVGDQGMTLFALRAAVDLSEPDLQALLNRLVLSGHVRCTGESSGSGSSPRARYRLTWHPVYHVPVQRRSV